MCGPLLLYKRQSQKTHFHLHVCGPLLLCKRQSQSQSQKTYSIFMCVVHYCFASAKARRPILKSIEIGRDSAILFLFDSKRKKIDREREIESCRKIFREAENCTDHSDPTQPDLEACYLVGFAETRSNQPNSDQMWIRK